ncbi:MAG: twin-arginine translocation signal domain-containing protein, partial [Acidobacteria bacterium]|nr:twin-arginine translocation signal domain-containing protein [Acidobacteriota bacterium]
MGKTHPAPAADPISRRDFLRSSAAAGLGAAFDEDEVEQEAVAPPLTDDEA